MPFFSPARFADTEKKYTAKGNLFISRDGNTACGKKDYLARRCRYGCRTAQQCNEGKVVQHHQKAGNNQHEILYFRRNMFSARYFARKKNETESADRVISMERRESSISSPVFIRITSAIRKSDTTSDAMQACLKSKLRLFNRPPPLCAFWT